MASGATERIALDRASTSEMGLIIEADVRGEGVSVFLEEMNRVLVVEADSDSEGLRDVVLRTSRGNELLLPVVIEARPPIAFSYTPPEGHSVRSVSVAGSFNGWNAGADPMERGDDGVFRIEMPVPPGEWTYKFVVDGDWISDPSNPRQDTSGYGNSLLTVPGSAREEVRLTYRGSSDKSDPGFIGVLLNNGEQWRDGSLRVVVNNRVLSRNSWTHTDDGRVVLRASQPAWKRSNWVTVAGETTEGRFAADTFAIDFHDAPRSPADEVFYFPMTDRFFDGDPSNNWQSNDERVHPLADYKGGDWAGITQKIREGYFADLGVTGLWISPVNENTYNIERESVPPFGYYTSYHGYWPISMTETNKRFGTMDELREMVATAHEHGMTILLDFVSNHVHVDNPLFIENPGLQSVYELPDGRDNLRLFDDEPFTTWFDTFIPTIDYEANPQALDIMVDNAIWWLRETGADGFRQDAVKHVPLEFWRTLTRRLDEQLPDREIYQVGETIAGYGLIAEFVGPDLLTGQFDFAGYFTMRDVIGFGNGSMRDLGGTVEAARRNYPAGSVMSPLIGNHDVARFMAYADGDLLPGQPDKHLPEAPAVEHDDSYEKLLLAFAWLAAVPGAPMLYYGDEIGMTGAGDPDNRRMMQWQGLEPIQEQTRDHVGDLFRMRLASHALRRGHPEVVYSDDEVLVVMRSTPGERVIAVMARRPAPGTEVTFSIPALGEVGSVEPLLTRGISLAVDGATLSVPVDQSYAYGFFRLVR